VFKIDRNRYDLKVTELPQGQNYFDLYSFLEAWEERYGALTSKQSGRFLSDSRLLTILMYHKYSVEASLDNFKTFDEIISDLELKSLSGSSAEYVEITPESLGMEDPEPWATTLGELGLE
jgi:hypothetical protein